MAKSINLNPGADATLVTAAYRAAMANTPKDYSRTLQRAADSYDKTMQAQGKVFKNLASIGAKIGGDMIKTAEEFSKYAALGSGLDPDGAQFLVDDLYGIKDEIKELGVLGGRLGDRETRQKRQELLIKQKNLMAEIDLAAASIKAGSDAVAAGNYDANINEADSEMVHAIIKSNLKDKHTKDNLGENNNYAKLGRDETSGELIYTLYDSKTNKPAIDNLPGGTGKPKTMTLAEFNNNIATNVDDKGALQTVFNTYNNKKADDGFKSRDGVYDEQMKALDSNWLTSTLKTPTDLRRAMRTSFGYSDTSFYDDIQKPSMLSAGLYKDLLSLTDSEGGVLSEGGIVEGVKDIDGLPGISEKDLQNATNYGILAGNILGMKDPDLSAKYFKKYTLDKFEEAYKYGFGKKPPTPGSGRTDTETQTGKYGGWGSYSWTTKGTETQQGSNITWVDAERRRNDLDALDPERPVSGVHGYYTWDTNKNMFVRDDGEEFTMYQVATTEGLDKVGESKNDFNPSAVKVNADEKSYSDKGLATPSILKDASGDDAASNMLNQKFGFSKDDDDNDPAASDYYFTPYTGGDWYESKKYLGDNVFSNDVMLIDRGTGQPVMDGKNPRRFGTGDNYKVSDLDWINDFLKDYLPKQNVITDFEDPKN
tara:strand:- start:1860 stop:3812 length:1953 start_codon:yes stop_codon:yes gene_type:complete